MVNAVTGHDNAHKGINGYVTAVGSTNGDRRQAAPESSIGTEKWLFWGNGGGQRSGDYSTPIGKVRNSFSREENFPPGFGYYPDQGFFQFQLHISTSDVMEFRYDLQSSQIRKSCI